MRRLELSVATHDVLTVRRFSVTEAISSPYDITLIAEGPNDDIPLEDVVGHPAMFAIAPSLTFALGAPLRFWSGFCTYVEQLQPEKTGNSTYLLRLGPKLWFLSQRRLTRIFQHQSVPEIVKAVLSSWGIAPDDSAVTLPHKKREFVVQYGETDLAFASRLLEEEGIAYYFRFDPAKSETLCLTDQAHLLPDRPAIELVGNPQLQAQQEYVDKAHLGHQVRPGKYTVRDFDFRNRDFKLLGESKTAPGPEDKYEQYRYLPGASLVEPGDPPGEATPFADDKGVARHEEKTLTARAQRGFESVRRFKQRVTFVTNCVDLAAGSVFAIRQHPHPEIKDKPLLLTEFTLEGEHDKEWTFAGEGVFAGPDHPYQPDLRTPKPRILGVQSAIVVGPTGEEIHTDEFGRIRVQFQWDRDHKRDENSSCWIRVSQAWAGARFGTMMIPRVGTEVLVSFFDGDPDMPVVVGRLYNGKIQVPYRLPDNQTQSVWKSQSTPKVEGSNEITFEDKKGEEFIYVQAQRDYQRLVKRDETERNGDDHHVYVGDSRQSIVAKADATLVGGKYQVQMIAPPSEDDLKILLQKKPDVTPKPTKIEMVKGEIVATSGPATMLLKGGNLTFEAAGSIRIKSKGGSVIFEGGPNIKINC
jgi:type VI secretion system secreted protein VgrG